MELNPGQIEHWERQLEASKKAVEVACRALGKKVLILVDEEPHPSVESD